MRFSSLLLCFASLLTCTTARSTCTPLNPSTKYVSSSNLPDDLRVLSLKLKSKFASEKGDVVHYEHLRASMEYRDLVRMAGALPAFDLDQLRSPDEKKSFWINLYNTLVVHAVVARRVEGSVQSQAHFFDRSAYKVDGQCFSLDDIEHGILRANRPRGNRGPIWKPGDPRLPHALGAGEFDPRIHFALNCASRGCPPIAFYRAATLDTDLDLAMKNFIFSEVRADKDFVSASKIFEWYETDFSPSVEAFLLRHASPPVVALLKKRRPIRFHDYDWTLNALPAH